MDEYLQASALLNSMQKEAVEATEGYVRVIAGAGSGKTRTLSMRYAWLVQELGIMPSSILCVTFTNKSAAEMRRRIHRLTGDEDAGYICTFHSFCHTVLMEESHAIHFPKSFMVMDGADIDDLLKLVYDERGLTSRDMTFSQARMMIEMKKIREIPEYRMDLINLSLQELDEKYRSATQTSDIIFYGYLYQQKKCFALDYDDLILLTLHIFEQEPDIAAKWQERLEYIMIDEFQDIDELQYRLMTVLQDYHHNLFVVGDPDQTIYTWRGARVEYLTHLDQNFKPVRTIFLNENYRSTPQILSAANALIAHNRNRMEKELIPMEKAGAAVHACHYENPPKEAQGVLEIIRHLQHKGYSLRDIVILYRAHYMSRTIEDKFLEEGIPYTIFSGVPFFSRMEIKDAISYCRMLLYKDDIDFLRTINTPKRNIGKTRIAFLQTYAKEHGLTLYEALLQNLETEQFRSTKANEYVDLIETYHWQDRSVTQILSDLLDLSGYEKMMRLQGGQERLDNLAELKQAAAEFEISWGEDITLEGWIRHVALFSGTDSESGQDRVRMMTIHTAKGLEFPCVILVGLSEGMFPSRQTRTRQRMEEERRLAFVAATRAKKELWMTEAEGTLLTGTARYPSRFLLEMGEENVCWNPKPSDQLLDSTKRLMQSRFGSNEQGDMESLAEGDRVLHSAFGEGTILRVDHQAMCYTVLFDQLGTRRTLSFRARLKRIGHEKLDTRFS